MVTTRTPSSARELSCAQKDGFGSPVFPAFFDRPDFIERAPITSRDVILSSNIAHLQHRIAELESRLAERKTETAPCEEIVELHAKAAALTEKGAPITPRRLLTTARLHDLPVNTVRNTNGSRPGKLHYMSGNDWRILTQRIGKQPD